MNREDRIAQGLETGDTEGLSPEDSSRIHELRAELSSEDLWAELPDALSQQLIRKGPTVPRGAWAAAAILVAIVGTLVVIGLANPEAPAAVAIIEVEGTELAPSAAAKAALIPLSDGWAIAFEVDGLDPAPPGKFYQGWVSNGSEGVAVGTFHMRGNEQAAIALWSGVDLHEYNTLNITLQTEGEGQQSSGILVMTGTAGSFDP